MNTYDAIISSPVTSEKNICGLCNEQAELRCTRCRKVHSCSPKHQAEHWSNTKKQCNNSEVKQTDDINKITLRQNLMDLQKEFNIPVSDADLGSLLSEIEDDELRIITI